MQDRLVLISDDADFFEYIIPKLSLRKTDEIFRFRFEQVPEKAHLLTSSILIINSEGNQNKTIELLEILPETPSLVFGYNDDSEFKIKAYKAGMFAYFSMLTSDIELKASLIPALKQLSILKQRSMYRELLIGNKIIEETNEVFLNSNNVLDIELKRIQETSSDAVLMAIAPNEKSKFAIQTNQIETIILNNIRKNDILLKFAASKYFLLLYDTNVDKAQKIWEKFNNKFSVPIYAGFAFVGNKSRQQLVNEVLNKLHENINRNQDSVLSNSILNGNNFKFNRQEFKKHLDQIISPVFYQVQQFYNDKLYGVKIEQYSRNNENTLKIISKYIEGYLKIASPGFSVINIDISYTLNENLKHKNFDSKILSVISDAKRITFSPHDFDSFALYDILECFIEDYKKCMNSVEGIDL